MSHNDAVQVGQTEKDYADLDCSLELDADETLIGGIAWIVLALVLLAMSAF